MICLEIRKNMSNLFNLAKMPPKLSFRKGGYKTKYYKMTGSDHQSQVWCEAPHIE